MKIDHNFNITNVSHILDHADALTKEYDESSKCKEFILEKINSNQTKTFTFIDENNTILGLGVIELLDVNYGNLILHTIEADHEAYFAHFIAKEGLITNNILELIQFRNSFSYRDEFIRMGYREKERVRMIHKNIASFKGIQAEENTSFKEITENDCETCGTISYHSHKHRINIECYDVYSSIEKRTKFCLDLRNKKHGKSIDPACLLLNYKDIPVGVIDITHVTNLETDIGWIMDISLLPDYQGMGLGKHLLEYALGKLNETGYEQAGLGVTLSNKNAHELYKKIGFEEYDFFVEIIAR